MRSSALSSVAFLSLILAAMYAGLTASSDTGEAAFPGPNGKIAMSVRLGNDTPGPQVDVLNDEILVMNPDGSGLVNVTRSAVGDYDPDWSPDGTKIVFSSYRDLMSDLFRVDADGSNIVKLTSGSESDGSPAWSPDGSRIAFASQEGQFEDFNIYVVNKDGSEIVRLTHHEYDERFPAWSPDGSKIAFTRYDSKFLGGIYVMNADGGSQTELVGGLSWPEEPTWSPDGKNIAYSDGRAIHVMSPDGSKSVKLTNNYERDIDWSPDGTKIAFNRGRDVYVMNADGTGETRLTTNPDGVGILDLDWGINTDFTAIPATGGSPAGRMADSPPNVAIVFGLFLLAGGLWLLAAGSRPSP